MNELKCSKRYKSFVNVMTSISSCIKCCNECSLIEKNGVWRNWLIFDLWLKPCRIGKRAICIASEVE